MILDHGCTVQPDPPLDIIMQCADLQADQASWGPVVPAAVPRRKTTPTIKMES
jgi:hypothetical protein